MNSFLNPPLEPKNGFILRVLVIARISTVHQDKRSLDDQIAKAKEYLGQVYSGKIDWKIIQSQGSGEHLDRKELHEAEDFIEGGQCDLVISEDLARICRRKRAYDFCELCIDHNTRLIAINDRIDTAVEGWEDSAFISTWHHERSNRDTSQRIRRSLRNRFNQGGVFQFVIYGYIKPPGAKTDAEISKDPAAEPIYDEWFRKLEDGASYCEVADWLNAQKIPPGPFSQCKEWTGPSVGRVTHNLILKGVRVRNDKMSRRIHKTGHHVAVKAPPEARLTRVCPHLAFIEPERFDRVIAMLTVRNARYKRKKQDGVDPRKNVSKKRTVWPGQHLRCGVCKREFYWSGVRGRKMMTCSGIHEYRCWNGVEISGELVCTRLTTVIFQHIMALPEFDDTFMDDVRQQWLVLHGDQQKKKHDIDRRIVGVKQDIANVTEAIAKMRHSRSLQEKLQELEKDEESLELAAADLARSLPPEPVLPSIEDLKQKATEVFTKFAPDNQEVARLMRILIPKLKVYPVQLCDGGSIELEAHFRLNLAALTNRPSAHLCPSLMTQEIVVDLFDKPQREKYREQVVRMRESGMTHREIANHLGITLSATYRAAALQRLMDGRGLTDPYVSVTEPPSDTKLKRHLHPRYRFEPLDDRSLEG
jgi:site-specific DNA recombinase